MKSVVRNLTCFFLMSMLPALGWAQEPNAFVPAWLNDGSPLSEPDLQAIVAGVGAQQANPDHIAVLVHGLGNSRETSTEQFNTLAPLLAKQYQDAKQTVVVVGVQWDSDVPMGLFTAESNYLDMVARARKVGHWPARQLLLQMKKQYPNAHFDIYAHSLGCEVSAACLFPEAKYGDGIPKSETFEPQQILHVNMWSMVGSDLDYDIWAKSGVAADQTAPRCKQAWMTMSPYFGEADKDETLKLRAMVRGVAAGSAFPKMTEEQYDTILKAQRVVFDNANIPSSHAMLEYYDATRLGRIVPMALHAGEPQKLPLPKEFDEITMVMAMPDQATALLPYLDSPNLTTQLTALWRLEHVVCGSSKHLADGTLEAIARLLKDKPATVRSVRKDSPCKVLNQGYFPTEKQLERAGAPNW